MGKLKTVWRGTRQSLLILLITLVLAEIVFRVYNYMRPSFIFYQGSQNQFRGKPNERYFDFHLNSKGFKDVEFNAQKAENTYRILGLGDSFAFGVVPYRHVYLTVLDEILNQNGKKSEVINMGIPGTGPRDYFTLLESEGLELKPDMVLLSFFIGNDFMEKEEERKLYSYSYVASFVYYMVKVSQGLEESAMHRSDEYDDTAPTFSDPVFINLESERSEIYRKTSKRFENELAVALGHLIRIKKLCDTHNIAMAIVLLPDEVQVNPTVQSRVLQVKSFNASADDFDFTLPNRLLTAKLKEQGIEVFDLLDSFSGVATQTTLYRPRDTHWNIAGNKLAAQVIAQNMFRIQSGAGTSDPIFAGAPTEFEGFHDETDCRSIKGWVLDKLHPNQPVKVELYDGDLLFATVTANQFRKDLLDAGKGNGAHAFEHPVPEAIKDGKPHAIRARIAGTMFNLTDTPRLVRCPPE
jgi:hypothetical protein